MKLIETKTLATAQSSIEFTDIPQDFTDLYVLVSARSAGNGDAQMNIKPNGSTSSLTIRRLQGSGSSASSSSGAELYARVNPNDTTANTFANTSIYIPNYAGSTNKTFSIDSVYENNATLAVQAIFAGLWSSTAAITSITIGPNSSNFVTNTTASLYGIGGAGDGWAPKATGGMISKIDGYYVHTFTASGTFTPTQDLTDVEYLVIAGGGGSGGNTARGPGGAGGYRSAVIGESSGGGNSAETPINLETGVNYTVTVGAGGADLASGSNSVFSTITSIGGGVGGAFRGPAGTGGSGGGAGFDASGGAGTANQGRAGGNSNGNLRAAGGGGASTAGQNGVASGVNPGAAGGAGVTSSITGTAIGRAGGGGGVGESTPGPATDGGGAGAPASGGIGTNGTVNTGGGGGSGNTSGGSGIVIVRYAA